MNIILVFTYGYSLKIWKESGTLDRELSIYKNLNKRYKCNFIFVTYGDESELDFDISEYGISIFPIYKYATKSKNKIIGYIKSFYFPFLIQKHVQEFDLIKQNQLLGSWVSIILKLLSKKPLFLRTGYDMYLFSSLENKNKITTLLYKFLTKTTLYFSDIYSVSSNRDFKFISSLNKNSNDIKIRPNWIIENNIQLINLERRYNNRILSVGRLEKQKNYEFLIKAFKDTNITIDLVGAGSLKNRLESISKQNKVKLNIIEPLENSEILNLMNKYKFFVTSSSFEGNPKTVLEAMSLGCIIFASKIDSHSELIVENVNGFLFDLNDPKNLIKQFQLNFENNNLLSSISKKSIDTVNKNFSLNKAVESEYLDYLSLRTESK